MTAPDNSVAGADAARVASLISEATPEADRLLEDLRSLPAAPSIVTELLSWPDGQVRFWALDAAARVFPRADYIKALKRATRDRDEVVRAEAVGQLADIAPDAVRPMARRLAGALQTDIPTGEKVFVLWTLAKIRSVDLIPAIEAFRQPLPDWWQLTRVADVVLTYLKDGEQVVLRMLENHSDHERMEELCTLAWHVLATPAARNALKTGLANAPDDACRQACQVGLDRFGKR